MTYLKISFFYLLYSAVGLISGERLHEQIYSPIDGTSACFRRLNGTHQAGCSSSNNGGVGIVQMVDSVDDASWIVFNSSAGSYIAVVRTSLFNSVIELFMKNPQNVAGILLYEKYNDTDFVRSSFRPSFFSQESRCPNEYSSAEGSQCSSTEGGSTWNEHGTGLLRRDIPFPIFYLPESQSIEIDKINMCYKRFNLDRDNHGGQPLCSIQLNSFMFAAVNSEVCLRRSASSAFVNPTKMCDPLGDRNVYYSLFPRAKEAQTGNRTVTLVTARIDSATLFDGLSPGAASSVVGMVTLITAASTLSKMLPLSEASRYSHNILWTLLNGESFDYIGSQRVAYDLRRGVWPPDGHLPLAHVALHLELGQLGGAVATGNAAWALTAFAPYTADAIPNEIQKFLLLLDKNIDKNITIMPKFTRNIPPSSLHSFRRILENATDSDNMQQLLLVDHDNVFTNKFYQSVLDDYRNIGFNYHNISVDSNGTFLDTDALLANKTMTESEVQVKIARLATALSRALYERVTETVYNGEVTASAHLVDETLYCLVSSQVCRLLMAADFAGPALEGLPAQPAPLYVSVSAWPAVPPVFAGHLLALLAGRHLPGDKEACDAQRDNEFSYYWLNGWNNSGVCIQTTMNFTQAVSPAFIETGYEMGSGVYSTWTESVWQPVSARVFVRAAGGGARAAAAAGAASAVLAAALSWWLGKHARTVFAASSSGVGGRDSAGILRTVNC